MNTDNLLYVIPAGQYGKEGVLALLEQHREIKFVSLVGVDLAGNDTDEKFPSLCSSKSMKAFLTVPLFKRTVLPSSCPVLPHCRTPASISRPIPTLTGLSTITAAILMKKRVSLSVPCAFRAFSSTRRASSIPAPSCAIRRITSAKKC